MGKNKREFLSSSIEWDTDKAYFKDENKEN